LFLVCNLLRSLLPQSVLLLGELECSQSSVLILFLPLLHIDHIPNLKLFPFPLQLLLDQLLFGKLIALILILFLLLLVHLLAQVLGKLGFPKLVLFPLVFSNVNEAVHRTGDTGPRVLIIRHGAGQYAMLLGIQATAVVVACLGVVIYLTLILALWSLVRLLVIKWACICV